MQDLYCDICGKAPVRAQILVEGAKMLACGSCMRSGKVLFRFDEGSSGPPAPAPSSVETSEEIVEGYGRIIRGARERMKLPLSVVAERIKEQENYLNAIENGRLTPTMEVARKLEKELGVKLVEKTQSAVGGPSGSTPKTFTPPTLGDMIEAKKKKEK